MKATWKVIYGDTMNTKWMTSLRLGMSFNYPSIVRPLMNFTIRNRRLHP